MKTDNYVAKIMARYSVEQDEKWTEISGTIPFVKIPEGWEICFIPPFARAVARFIVKVPGSTNRVSVYLDFYDALGCMGQPYWEVYNVGGSSDGPERCLLNETEELIRLIEKESKGVSE